MARLLITGAAGFLGAQIARQALAAGHDVRGLDLPSAPLQRLAGLDLRLFAGDVTRPATLWPAMEGAEVCIHTAGNSSHYRGDWRALRAINVEGVQHVVAAAKAAGVRRFIHTSSVAAIGYGRDGRPVDENATWNWPRGFAYMETKRDGERVARAAATRAFEVVTLNPATIYGPGKLHGEQGLIGELRSGKLLAVPSGGRTLCDVDDVAHAHLAALERGRGGERYILGGPHVTHLELSTALAHALGVRPPRYTAPAWALSLLGGALSLGEAAGLRLRIPAASLRLGSLHLYHSCDKAVAELGYRTRPLAALVARSVLTSRSACESPPESRCAKS